MTFVRRGCRGARRALTMPPHLPAFEARRTRHGENTRSIGHTSASVPADASSTASTPSGNDHCPAQ
ncbi:hypothetical protein LX90_000715 [Lentzea flava]|nr:hypothetical protein [Lentzea flava]